MGRVLIDLWQNLKLNFEEQYMVADFYVRSEINFDKKNKSQINFNKIT